MNTRNNLHNALNKAFENHQEPLNQAQWDRLEGAMSKKKRRRFFPFFLLFIAISFTAGITYFLTLNYGLKDNQTKTFSSKQSVNSKSNPTFENKNSVVLTETNSMVNTNSIADNTSTPTQKRRIEKYKKPIYPSNQNNKKEEEFIEQNPPIIIAKTTEPEYKEPAKDIVIDIPQKEDKFEEAKAPEKKMEMDIALKTKDTTYASPKDKEDDKSNKPPSRFVFSIAPYGYSNMKVKVSGIENGEKLHKDTRKLFEESNKDLKAQFISIGFDWNILPRFRIGINSGFQYLRITTPININYQLKEVPFWDSRHTQILGYASDTNGLHFNSNINNYTTYITLPLRINYSIPLTPKNEIVLTAGFNLSTLVAAKGQSVSINKERDQEPGVKPLSKDMYSTINSGFATGMQYNFNFKDNWWIGLQGLWQTNSLKYKTGYGSINNKLQGYNVNFIIKYKI